MIFNSLRLALGVVLVATCVASAQVRVVKGAGEKSSIDWAGFSAAGDPASQTFLKTLADDLLRSGWFKRGTPGSSEFALTGNVADQGSLRVQADVYGRVAARQLFGKTYSHEPAKAQRLAHIVADEIIEAVTGRKGLCSARLAMVGNRSGKKEIYLCDADGQGLIQLTRDNSISIGPNWSPDGRQLIYTSYMKNNFPDVYTIDLGSGSRQRVAGFPGLNTGAAIAPNGRDVALILSKGGNPDLYVMNLGGGGLVRLTNTQRAGEASPSWAPDGSKIVYVSDQAGSPQLYVISRTGGEPRRITSRGAQNVAPDWGKNNLIAYASLFGGRWNICVLDPNTLEVKQITNGDADYEDPSWAPDGRHLASGRAVRYQSKVYLLDTMGDPPIALTDYPGDWYSPAWDPGK